MVIKFEEALKDSTTYTFNFGSAIKDLHEGNKLLNFEYVFSTGDVLDSLSVKGTLKYAFDLSEPEEPISIMLYKDLRDSVPLTDIPLYVARSDDSGVFSINNLRPDTFKVFALKDGNNNLLFDLPSEEIAFLDSNLIVNAEFARQLLLESTLGDTTLQQSDSIRATLDPLAMPGLPLSDSASLSTDSTMKRNPVLNSIFIDLLLFTEETDIQYLTNYTREDRRKIQLVFAGPLTDSFSYKPILTHRAEPLSLLEYYTPARDSLTLWIVDSTDYKQDTLRMEIRFTVKDTSNQYVIQKDTLLFSYRERNNTKKKQLAEIPMPELLQVTTIRNKGIQDLHRKLALNINLPLKEIQDSLINIYQIPDSIEITTPFQIAADTSLLTRVWLTIDWKSEMKYRMVLYPGALSSVYPLEHDTVDVTFQTRDMEYYGQILLSLENVHNQILVQLISKDKVIRELPVNSDGVYAFGYLVPQEYKIKVIHDLNENGRWDTGKYILKRQPEPIELLPVSITVSVEPYHYVTMKLEK